MFRVFSEVRHDLDALVESDFGPSSRSSATGFLDWLHYRARLVPIRPRRVKLSKSVRTKAHQFPALGEIERRFSSGDPVSPWLSSSIRRAPADPRADMMFNDWQILHFHLGSLSPGGAEAGRTGPLLFAYVEADLAVLLDVHSHSPRPWALTELLHVLLATHEPAMVKMEAKGVRGPEKKLTDDEILILRNKHSNSLIPINGRLFMAPGMGVASSGHSTRFVHRRNWIMRRVADLMTTGNAGGLDALLRTSAMVAWGAPVRLGVRYNPDGVMKIVDKARGLTLAAFTPLE